MSLYFINKQEDITSFDLIKSFQKKFNFKKIGHSGTLDKFASGLLIVFSDNYVKLSNIFLKMDKEYIVKIKFGYQTDTLDRNGSIVKTSENIPCIDDIQKAAKHFLGPIKQKPPIYSRVSVNGKRAYKSALAGEDITLEEKDISIYDIDIKDYQDGILTFSTFCSSGTYIRSLSRDIACILNSACTVINLQRSKIGNINLDQANSIDDIDINDNKNLLSYIDEKRIINIDSKQKENILSGRELRIDKKEGVYVAVFQSSAIAVIRQDKTTRYSIL